MTHTGPIALERFKKATGAFLDAAFYVQFMQEQLPDELWCTDPEFHFHSPVVVKVTMGVIAEVVTHEKRGGTGADSAPDENSKAVKKAKNGRKAEL